MALLFRVLKQFPVQYSTRVKSGINMKKALDKTMKDESLEILNKILANYVIQGPEDVNNMRTEVLNKTSNFSERTVDRAIINYFISNKQFKSGLNYLDFLDKDIKTKLKLFLANQYFRLFFFKHYMERNLSEKEEGYLLTLYEKLRKDFPILDVISLETAIMGLSITREWKKCDQLLDEIKKFEEPSAICLSAVTAGAFLNNEEEMAWNTFEEMFDKQKKPNDIVFTAYLEKCQRLKDKSQVTTKLHKLFIECGEKDIIFSEKTISELRDLLEQYGITNELTSIDKKGYCSSCQQKLCSLEPHNAVFEKLKEKIVKNVIIGKNIFSKTTPEEFSRFQEFVGIIHDCNVVIDGLNVAYSIGVNQPPQVYSALLAHVVSYFVKRGKEIVVLGRAHMQKWPKQNWNYILEHSRVFLTQDNSQDDPYLLYCALHCGKDAIIVTRDLMRSHLFLLKDPKDKLTFSRWLSQRQYQLNFVTKHGKVLFLFPLPYTRTTQQNSGNWHLPYNRNDTIIKNKNEDPNNWLCIQSSHIN